MIFGTNVLQKANNLKKLYFPTVPN